MGVRLVSRSGRYGVGLAVFFFFSGDKGSRDKKSKTSIFSKVFRKSETDSIARRTTLYLKIAFQVVL